jgi:phage-related minor tail protein
MAADNEIKVLLTAEIAQLQAGMDAGAESVAASTAAITASMEGAAAATTVSTAAIGESADAAAVRIKAMVASSLEQAATAAMVGESERSLAERMGLRVEATAEQIAATQASIAAQDAQMVSTSGFVGVEEASTAAIVENTAAIEVNAMSSRTSYELGVLLSEAASGNFSRMKRSVAALGNSTGVLQSAFTGIGPIILATSAAILGFGYEMVKGAEASNDFNKALVNSGSMLGVTESGFDGMAAAIQSSETTIGTAREAMMKLAESGRFSGQAMQDAGKAAVDFAALTGQSIDQAVAAVIKIQEKPVQALEKLNEQYHFLTLAQIEHIQKLQDEGDAVGASTEAVKIFEQTSADRLQKADKDVGLLVQSWRGLKGAISAAANAVQDFGKKQSGQAKFDELDARRDRLLKDQAGGATVDVNSGQNIQGMIDKTTAQMAALQDARVAQEKLTSAQVENQKVQDAGIAAKGEIDYLKKVVKGTDAYTEALEKAKAALKATHDANAGDASLKGVTFDEGGNASGGDGLAKIEAALHKRYDVKATAHASEHKLDKEELKLAEATQQVSDANKLRFELDFWTKKLGEAKGGTKEYADVYAQVLRLTTQVDAQRARAAKEAAAEQQQIQSTERQAALSHAQAMIDIQRIKIQTQFDMGLITAQQEDAALAAENEKEYQDALSYLQKDLALLNQKPVEVAKINAQIEALEDKHAKAMAQINEKSAKDNETLWKNRLAPISQAFNASINGMIQGTQTLQQSMAHIADSIAAKYVQLGIDLVVKWTGTELAKTTASTVGAAERATVEAGAAAVSKASDAATGKSQITSAAATGAAKAYQAIVGIPIVGPVLAPIAAAVAYAGISEFGGSLSSARGGWERVPIDGMMTELHKDEMVLPAHIANPMRQMAQGGGQGGGGVTVNLSSTDPRAFSDYLRRNSGVLADAIKHANRRGHFGGAR